MRGSSTEKARVPLVTKMVNASRVFLTQARLVLVSRFWAFARIERSRFKQERSSAATTSSIITRSTGFVIA